jgi:hypothetical protein
MGKQLSLFDMNEIDQPGVETIYIIGWGERPMQWRIVPTVFSDFFLAKRKLNDGFPAEILVRKIDEKTYQSVLKF